MISDIREPESVVLRSKTNENAGRVADFEFRVGSVWRSKTIDLSKENQ